MYQRTSVSGVLNSGRRMVRAGHNARKIPTTKTTATGLSDCTRNVGYKAGCCRKPTFGEQVVARVTIGTVEPVDYVQANALAADVATLCDDAVGNACVARDGNLTSAASTERMTEAVTEAIGDLDELGDLDF